uniref:probable phenylalanine--tRNA ligase alpha subunit isoform X2 n=1 Tax=Fragaria vesca subsp. vesca TaxID=101020 RepID=UPI0005C9B3B4|nr:PREDICTED: probable phenylalanine--tRNA ligase alpha subunit isoform X2 [Fragaria vesca subsp. vesca]
MADSDHKRATAEDAVLRYLENHHEITDSLLFAAEVKLNPDDIANAIKSLHGHGYVDKQEITKETWLLTEEGKTYAVRGSPEMQLFLSIPPEGITIDELQKKFDESSFKIARAQAAKNKWVDFGKQLVTRRIQHVDNDKVQTLLLRIQDRKENVSTLDISQEDIKSLTKRKLISLQVKKLFSVRRGPNYAPERKKVATDLTRDMLQSSDWKNMEFKEFNLNAKGAPTEHGCLHPLLKVRKQLKDIFLQMGFAEMPTNNYVESSFWNFDALFQPQQHPARDSHDTFFLKVPSTTKELPEDYVERVKRIHESGGHQSRGYGYDWKREEADKSLLRTHTTAVSSRMLYSLAQDSAQKPFAPKKYFSIDRVFRNEAVDRTHLAEFHQIEGLICDRGLTLGDLIGVLEDFFSRLGMSDLKFKPAYNPYTEPSMEIFGYHKGFGKYVEIGNHEFDITFSFC